MPYTFSVVYIRKNSQWVSGFISPNHVDPLRLSIVTECETALVHKREKINPRRFQEKMGMEDAVMCDNGPKEISIFCHQAPEVSIVDLAADHRENNECL